MSDWTDDDEYDEIENGFLDSDNDDDEGDDLDGITNEDLGWCPHGAADDEGCDEPGCHGGPDGDEEYGFFN